MNFLAMLMIDASSGEQWYVHSCNSLKKSRSNKSISESAESRIVLLFSLRRLFTMTILKNFLKHKSLWFEKIWIF